MKWFFILLLLVNFIYLGWEIDRDSQLTRAGISSAISIPAGTPRLSMLTELHSLPEKRISEKSDDGFTIGFNSEPVLPIDLNPNTKQIISTLSLGEDISNPENEIDETVIADQSDELSVQAKKVKSSVCYTYGPIPNIKESDLLSDWLGQHGILYRQRTSNEQGKQLFWVYLETQKTREHAEAAFRDLKEKGVSDIRLIREGDLLNTISLGLFSSQASVNRRLNEISTKGYGTVVVPYADEKTLHWVDVSVVHNSSYINDLFTGFPSRFNALPVKCDEIAMQQGNL